MDNERFDITADALAFLDDMPAARRQLLDDRCWRRLGAAPGEVSDEDYAAAFAEELKRMYVETVVSDAVAAGEIVADGVDEDGYVMYRVADKLETT